MSAFSPFEKRWMKIFAADISKQDIQRYVMNRYIWHVFSWKLKPEGSFLSGNEARQAYDAEEKNGAQYYESWPTKGPYEFQSDFPSAAELDKLIECYVISSDAKWTYIKTNEGDPLGPYFYKL